MGVVARFDPEGDDLVRRAEAAGGAEFLSEGERWRLQNTLDKRRRLEAEANAPSGRTDALDAQANERRFAALEAHMQWADGMLEGLVWPVVGEVIGEEGQRADAEAKRLCDELRIETEQKLNAQYEGFERAVRELRDTDRATILSDLRSTMSEAESRIDTSLAKALDAEKERNTIELALVRDEILDVVAAKAYGQLADDDAAKHVMAEKAIASLRKRMSAVEEDGARQAAVNNQLASVAAQLAALEDAYHKARKGLIVRCATTAVLLKKETARADELASKVTALEAALEQLTDALLQRKVI
jgi:hypothetical protein